jgi:hypothetical protein
MPNPRIAELGQATQFPVNRPATPHTQKGPYLVPLLKRFLEKKINYIDPETNLKIKGKVKDAILWRLILNATEGDTHAIREILDRFDGKVMQKTEVSGQVDSSTKIIIVYPADYQPKEDRIGIKTQAISS